MTTGSQTSARLALATLAVMPIVSPALAQSVNFSIPAMTLASALDEFSLQSHDPVIAAGDLVIGKESAPIIGAVDPATALARILQGTGLTFRRSGDTYLVVRLEALSANESAADSAKSPPMPISTANAPDEMGKPASAEGAVQDIIVTARRRSESLYKTPMTITVLTGDQLTQNGVVDANQLQYLAPNLSVSQGRQGVELTIRGISTSDTSTKGEPDIAFNIDGVPNLRSEQQSLSFFDIKRIEVLNGPQSTLYGVASTGGDVNIITNAPTWDRTASSMLEIGNYNTRRVQLMVNQPVNDQLSFRAAIADNQRNGYVKLIGGSGSNPSPGGEDNFSRRISLLARFNEEWQVRATEAGGNLGGAGQIDTAPIGVNANLVGHVNAMAYANLFSGNVDDRWETPTLTLDGAFGDVHLGILSNYNYYHENAVTPIYYQNNDGMRFWDRERYQTYFNELRFSNQNSSDRIQYIAGVNYLWQQNNEDGHGFDVDPTAPTPILSDFANSYNLINTTTQTSFSVFLHTITNLTGKLRLTLGVRQSFDRDDRVGEISFGETEPGTSILWPNQYGSPCVGLQSCYGFLNSDSGGQHTNAFTYNAGLDYQLTSAQMAYISAARGYKPGGFNDPNGQLGGNGTAPYGPEKLNAYEVGYKINLPTGTRLTADFYYYDYADQAITEQSIINGVAVIYTSLHSTSELGFESAATIPLSEDDSLGIFVNYEQGSYSQGNGEITGETLANMPAWVFGGNFVHYWKLSNAGTVKFHLETRYSAHYVEGTTPQFIQPAYTRSDADLSYITPSERFDTELFVNNIENGIQFTGATTGFGAPVDGPITTPRFWGVRELVKF